MAVLTPPERTVGVSGRATRPTDPSPHGMLHGERDQPGGGPAGA